MATVWCMLVDPQPCFLTFFCLHIVSICYDLTAPGYLAIYTMLAIFAVPGYLAIYTVLAIYTALAIFTVLAIYF